MRNLTLLTCLALFGCAISAEAQQPDQPEAKPKLVPLNPEETVLLDQVGRRLLVKTTVCLRIGVLEMLVCPRQTKEHESILSFAGKAQTVHAGLLALRLNPGHPARFGEKFEPPTGPKLELFVNWTDTNGQEHRRPAREWVRGVTNRYFAATLDSVPNGVPIDKGDDTLRFDPNTKELLWYGIMSATVRNRLESHSEVPAYREAIKSLFDQSQSNELKTEWVFAGSGFSETEDGRQIYQAESGSLVCVANFGDALIDVSMESSANDGGRLFEPYTERIPPEGTPVTLEIIPVAEK